jgi:hypothetical protein
MNVKMDAVLFSVVGRIFDTREDRGCYLGSTKIHRKQYLRGNQYDRDIGWESWLMVPCEVSKRMWIGKMQENPVKACMSVWLIAQVLHSKKQMPVCKVTAK